MKKSILSAFAAFIFVFPAFAEDITISEDTTYDAATHAGKNLTITGDSTLTFEDTATKATSAITLTLGDSSVTGDTGNITFNMTTPHSSVTHGADYSLAGVGGNVTIKGKGNITLTGGSHLAMISGSGGAVTISLDAGSKIDIQNGTFINGGWGTQYWSANKSDMNIESTGTVNMWDGYNICVAGLTGTGTISAKEAIRGYFNVGVNDTSSTFDGKFVNYATIYKTGTGTLTLTAASTNTGTTNSNDPTAAQRAILKHGLYIANGTVKLTDSGKPGNGSIQIDANGTLEVTNAYTFGNTISGTGKVILNYNDKNANQHLINAGATPANNFSTFEGDLYLNNGYFYVKSNAMSENMTIHLNGGDLRNNGGSYEVKSKVVLDSATGGLHPGWASQSLTVSGKISDGNASTLNIVSDNNVDDTASWIILSNPENDYTNTVVNHYLKVTATGALGTGTVTINSGKVLDLTSTSIAGSRLKNSGTITSSSTDSPAQIIITQSSELPTGTIQGNIQYVLKTNQTNIAASSASRTGGTLIQDNMNTNCVSYQAGLGTGKITLDNGLIMNNTYGLGLTQPMEITKKGGSIRAGWQVSKGALGVSGVISGEGKLTINQSEANSGAITLAGENTYTGGTLISGGGTNLIFIASNSPFGTGLVDASSKTTVLSFLTGGNYSRSYFGGAFNTTDALAVTATAVQMNDTVNTNDATLWNDSDKKNVRNNTTFSYVTTLTAEADSTLEFAKCLNESGQISITDLTTGTTTTLLSGTTTSETFAFQKGNDYKIDVRVGHGSGTVGVKGNGLNDDSTNKLGLGVRSATNSGNYAALTILEDGTFALANSGLKATARDCAVPNDLKIGTQTVKIQNTGIGNVTLSGKITGTGTLAVSNTSELASDLNGLVIFNGAPASATDKFNVTVATDTSFAGNGTIGGNLTLDPGSCLVMDETLGALKVTGNVTAQNITFDVTQTDLTSDLQLVADTIDVTGSTLNFAYNGETESLESLPTVSVLNAKKLTGTDSFTLNFSSETGARLAGYEFKDGQLFIQLGNANSVPEPSTWALLLLGLLGTAGLYRKKRIMNNE